MAENLADGRRPVRVSGRVAVDSVAQRNVPFIHAAQDDRGGDGLRETVEVKRRVGARRHHAIHVLLPERALPRDVVRPDDRGRQARDSSLRAQRFEVVAEAAQQQVVGGANRRASGNGTGNRESDNQAAHEWVEKLS